MGGSGSKTPGWGNGAGSRGVYSAAQTTQPTRSTGVTLSSTGSHDAISRGTGRAIYWCVIPYHVWRPHRAATTCSTNSSRGAVTRPSRRAGRRVTTRNSVRTVAASTTATRHDARPAAGPPYSRRAAPRSRDGTPLVRRACESRPAPPTARASLPAARRLPLATRDRTHSGKWSCFRQRSPRPKPGSILIQRENPGVYAGRESRHSGTLFTVAPVRGSNRGGMTAPTSGQSDNLGIPTRLSQAIPCGSGTDTDAKHEGTSESLTG